MARHNELGKKGEEKAAAYLLDQGYIIVARNYRHLHYEVDIIAWDHDELVMVEVRTRTSEYHEHPRDTISPAKINAIVSAAEAFILEHELDCQTRFDVICWLPSEDEDQWQMEHIVDAFRPSP
ncbi:YraN family protein [Thermophagus sp. OGC60D27]|uniref:YraN family protein n=1 Tax=Thermophagus sp. OGC60D27 TaxID=3458415 RepID=UPI004037A57A